MYYVSTIFSGTVLDAVSWLAVSYPMAAWQVNSGNG